MDEIKKLQDALADATARADKAEKSLREVGARADSAEGRTATLEAEVVKLRQDAKNAGEADRLQALLDKSTADLAAERKARTDAEDPKRFAVAVMARTKLEQSARVILADRFRADCDDRTIMIAALEKVQGPIADKDSRSDDYIRARFDAAVESYIAGERALRSREEERVVAVATRVDSRTARDKLVESNLTLKPMSEIK